MHAPHRAHFQHGEDRPERVWQQKAERPQQLSLTAFVRKTLRTVVGGESCAENFVFNAL